MRLTRMSRSVAMSDDRRCARRASGARESGARRVAVPGQREHDHRGVARHRCGAVHEVPAVASRDWSRLYSTQSTSAPGRCCSHRTHAPARRSRRAGSPRNLGVRAVSDDGSAIVLTENAVTGANPYERTPRRQTRLTVVRSRPEASVVCRQRQRRARGVLTVDALAVRHRVHATDRAQTGTASPASTSAATTHRDAARGSQQRDQLQEPMRGTARAQAMAPDGRRLYTLYTRDATATEPAEAFVHVLDLEHERATCVDLPPSSQ